METIPAESAPAPYGAGRGSTTVQLVICSFGVLALELGLIRWISGQIRLVAYFTNLILLAAFLGMGLGVALGRRRPALLHYALPVLAVFSAVLAFSEALNLVQIRFPDPSLSLWGAEIAFSLWGFVSVTLLMVALFWTVALVFLLASAPIGMLFDRLPPLHAYSADLFGSLLGVLAATAAAALGSNPAVWMGLACFPIAWMSRRPASFVAAFAIVALAAYSVKGAQFSPYNRIDVRPYTLDSGASETHGENPEWQLDVNRDFHQIMLDVSDKTIAASPLDPSRQPLQDLYTLPFRFHKNGGRALIVGAGTGNDVMGALRSGFTQVVSVDIDGSIIDLGRRLHPEHPYSDPRTVPVVNDARAYFEQHPDERFDVVCYGFLDSHAMFSSMSTLRLDNFVYTVEGIRAGWAHVKPGGVLSVCFSVYAGGWILARMAATIHEATGILPAIVMHNLHAGATFLVGKNLDLNQVPRTLGHVYINSIPDPKTELATDDWPYLYLRPGQTPYGYIAVLTLILLTAAAAVRMTYGRDMFTAQRFHVPLFFMGAAFMLIETRMVTELSLLFGSTWIVNACVFAGILMMVLAANLAVIRFQPGRLQLWFAPLAASLIVTWATGAGMLNRLPLLERGLVGGILYALPVAFAGVIFSSLFKRAKDPTSALGSNLLGAVIGGAIEYMSMYSGLKSMALIALGFYLAALFYLVRNPASAGAEPQPA